MFLVRVKQGHPTGVRHRAGKTFTAEPTKMKAVPEAVLQDPWLVVEDEKTEKPKLLTLEESLALDAEREKSAGMVNAPAANFGAVVSE